MSRPKATGLQVDGLSASTLEIAVSAFEKKLATTTGTFSNTIVTVVDLDSLKCTLSISYSLINVSWSSLNVWHPILYREQLLL